MPAVPGSFTGPVVHLGASAAPERAGVRACMEAALLDRSRRHHSRITASPEVMALKRLAAQQGLLIGFWDGAVTGKPFNRLTPAGRP